MARPCVRRGYPFVVIIVVVVALAVSVIVATLLQGFPLRKHIVNARQDASTPKDPLAKVSPFACFSGWGCLNGCCYLPPSIMFCLIVCLCVVCIAYTYTATHICRQTIYLTSSTHKFSEHFPLKFYVE